MPSFSIVTNVPKHKVPSSFLADLSKLISEKLKTPELYVAVRIKAGQPMFWFENESPCGLAALSGVGICGKEENMYYSSFLYDFIEQELGIPQTRLYISFTDQIPSNVGARGTTLEELIQ